MGKEDKGCHIEGEKKIHLQENSVAKTAQRCILNLQNLNILKIVHKEAWLFILLTEGFWTTELSRAVELCRIFRISPLILAEKLCCTLILHESPASPGFKKQFLLPQCLGSQQDAMQSC